MTKINQKEYEILKGLDDKWKWIAKDDNYGGFIFCFREKPHKDIRKGGWSPDTTQYKCLWEYDVLFQFIQWEDEEPHNIAGLIEEYESEETEVKDIEWLKKEFDDLFNGKSILTVGRSVVDEILNQLDEPETLSKDWVDRHTDKFVGNEGFRFVNTKDLQNLLVPKQEEVDRAYKDGYEKGKEHATKIIKSTIPRFVAEWIEFKKKSEIPYENVLQAIDELVNSSTSKAHDWVLKTSENKDTFARAWLDGYEVIEEQKYVVPLIKNLYLKQSESGGFGVGSIPSEMKYEFTEQEIKDYDERYWPFAVKVEGLEE